MARDYSTQLEMMSLAFLVIAVLLIFFAACGTKEIAKSFFMTGGFLAMLAIVLRVGAKLVKK